MATASRVRLETENRFDGLSESDEGEGASHFRTGLESEGLPENCSFYPLYSNAEAETPSTSAVSHHPEQHQISPMHIPNLGGLDYDTYQQLFSGPLSDHFCMPQIMSKSQYDFDTENHAVWLSKKPAKDSEHRRFVSNFNQFTAIKHQ